MKTASVIKKPKTENTQSITRTLRKLQLNESNNYTYNVDGFKRNLSLLKYGIPDLMIFSKTGRLIPYGNEYACNAAGFNAIEQLNPGTAYDINPQVTLTGLTNGLTDLYGKPVKLNLNENQDFTVLLFWKRHSGKLNASHVKAWEEQALNNKRSEITVIKINMDFQEHWGEENLRKIMSK